MSATTTSRLASIRRSAVLDDDAFEHVGDVLAAVGGVLEEVEDLLPLDDRDRVASPPRTAGAAPSWWTRSASFSRRLISTARLERRRSVARGASSATTTCIGRRHDDARPVARAVAGRCRCGRAGRRPPPRRWRPSRRRATASAWMSSRSSGVTKVRLSRWMISWVRMSHLCSTSLISSALSQTGRSGASISLEQRRALTRSARPAR